MSNESCAVLYNTIVDDVIFESRQDFENAGIDEQTLLDLREIWRQKLEASGVCRFPWQGEETKPNQEEGAVEGNDINLESNQLNNPMQMQNIPQLNATSLFGEDDDVTSNIKTEDLDILPKESDLVPESLPAVADVNQIKQTPVTPISTSSSQSTKKREPNIAFSINTETKQMKFEDMDDSDDDLGSDLGADSDAINSDLDDSDENEEDDVDGNEDGDSEMEQNIMLCLYDRVQRVRNRWKCALKDGIMNIDGKDYVFQKANGDSEW